MNGKDNESTAVTESRAELAAAEARLTKTIEGDRYHEVDVLGRARRNYSEFPASFGGTKGWLPGDAARDKFFLERVWPIEAEAIEFKIAIAEHNFDVAEKTYGLACARFAQAVEAGDPNAILMANIGDVLTELATRSQKTGDPGGIDLAVTMACRSYNAAFTALCVEGELKPPKIDPAAAYRALLVVARSRTANVQVEPRSVFFAGMGYIATPPDGLTTVDDVVAYFLTPRSPKRPVARIAALQKDLAMLNRRAFEIHERRTAIEKELDEEARLTRDALEREAANAAEQNAEREQQSARQNADAAARLKQIAEFAETMRRRATTIP